MALKTLIPMRFGCCCYEEKASQSNQSAEQSLHLLMDKRPMLVIVQDMNNNGVLISWVVALADWVAILIIALIWLSEWITSRLQNCICSQNNMTVAVYQCQVYQTFVCGLFDKCSIFKWNSMEISCSVQSSKIATDWYGCVSFVSVFGFFSSCVHINCTKRLTVSTIQTLPKLWRFSRYLLWSKKSGITWRYMKSVSVRSPHDSTTCDCVSG